METPRSRSCSTLLCLERYALILCVHDFLLTHCVAGVPEDVPLRQVKDIFEGINGTVFAYGQTGSGKSFTMFGKEHTEDPMLQGVIPRAATAIFEYCNASKENRTLEGGAENPANNVKSFEVKASYLEIYMGHVNDLLDPRKSDLKVHFDLRSKRGVWVEDLTECWVGSTEEIMDKIKIGDSNRHVSKTAMNEASSRSHSVFFIEVTAKF